MSDETKWNSIEARVYDLLDLAEKCGVITNKENITHQVKRDVDFSYEYEKKQFINRAMKGSVSGFFPLNERSVKDE